MAFFDSSADGSQRGGARDRGDGFAAAAQGRARGVCQTLAREGHGDATSALHAHVPGLAFDEVAALWPAQVRLERLTAIA